MQVHRSHWVAQGAVRAVRRMGDGAVITLGTGQEVPVSRRFIPALRQAGLLPQRMADGKAGTDHP
ncbi:MAG: LytTR family transcriptional regulator [Tabrizicola sp.]|nr:LytTR family transcriptional regulator [Tabrizicola sp.]